MKQLRHISLIAGLVGILVMFAPLPVQAVFGGVPTTQRLYVGYMLSEFTNGKLGLCGINYISSTVGITAAHCLQNVSKNYPNAGAYTTRFKETAFSVHSTTSASTFDPYATWESVAQGDITVIKLSEAIQLPEYASITSPTAGCNYVIIGYGRDQHGERYQRKVIDTCITNISAQQFEFTFPQKGEQICTGDSGTGIYRAGTNSVVGLVSAFESNTDCSAASVFYATRVDANSSLIENVTGESVSSPTLPPVDDPVHVPTNEDELTNLLNNIVAANIVPAVLVLSCCCVGFVGLLFVLALRKHKRTH